MNRDVSEPDRPAFGRGPVVALAATFALLAAFAAGEWAARRDGRGAPVWEDDPARAKALMECWAPLFRREETPDGEFWRQVPVDGSVHPPQRFRATKAPGVRRLAVVGESSALGLGGNIRILVEERGAGATTEVVNYSLGGASLEMVERRYQEAMLQSDPDAVVFLFGHNLYYHHPRPIRGVYELGRLARRSRLLSRFAERLFRRRDRDWGLWAPRLARYESFLARMAEETSARGIPLLLCTVPSNLRFPPRASDAESSAAAFLDAQFLRDTEGPVRAARRLRTEVDSRPSAQGYYLIAEWTLEAGDARRAAGDFAVARDLDPGRDRAGAAVDALIRGFAASRGLELLDFTRSVAAMNPDRIPGWDLFGDHQHVTGPAARREAELALAALERMGWDTGGESPPPPPASPAELGVHGDFMRSLSYQSDWMFVEWSRAVTGLAAHFAEAYPEYVDTLAETYADLPDGSIAQSDPARSRSIVLLEAAEGLKLRGRDEAAERLLRRAASVDPDGAEPSVRRARWSLRAGRRDEARRWLDRALQSDPRHPLARHFREKLGAAGSPARGRSRS